LFEHARLDQPRPECGYCTDDAGRALALACRLPADPDAEKLAAVTLEFLERAHVANGRFRLRLGADGRWMPDTPSDDAAGRALFGLGVAAAVAPWADVRDRAAVLFDAAVGFRSSWARANAYATLGAVEVLQADPSHRGARRLVIDAANRLPTVELTESWRWPEPRLTYANALLPDAALAAAVALGRAELAARALELLDWLVERETLHGRFSFAPVGGRGPGGRQPSFDQQPIEAWAMADACSRALACTGHQNWADSLSRAGSWFLGQNDTGAVMFDPATGGGFDGLRREGVNRNQGAESTLAFVATMLQIASISKGLLNGPPSTDGRAVQAAAKAPRRWETDAVAAPTQWSAAP
jgi:hypothetical protein